MDWTYLRTRLVRGTLAATVAAGLIAVVSWVSFALALISLMFAWPVADLVIEWLGARHAGGERRVTVVGPRSLLAVQLTLWVGISVVVAMFSRQSFLSAAALVLVCGAPAGGLLGILAEWEDGRLGGYHNPS